MNLKKAVKKYAPVCLLPLLRAGYRTIKLPYTLTCKLKSRHKISRIIARADKLRPYYRDELSQLILSDVEEYLLNKNNNIFVDRALKQGWRFQEISYFDVAGRTCIDKDKISGILVIYDDENSPVFKYNSTLLKLSDWEHRYRTVTVDKFMEAPECRADELIVLALSQKNMSKLLCFMYSINLLRNIHTQKLRSTREDLQYFDVFEPVDDEIIIDAGAFDGKTARQFLEWGRGKVKKIYSFEMDPVNAAKCEENLKNLRDKVVIINKGTWYQYETISINAGGTSGSSVGSKGSDIAYLTSIDSVVKDECVTFVKMDVEGAELKSLIGAKNTITRNKPRLAICVYHKPEDIAEIPEYILSLVPEYKFYLRHYCSVEWETVLYAFCD